MSVFFRHGRSGGSGGLSGGNLSAAHSEPWTGNDNDKNYSLTKIDKNKVTVVQLNIRSLRNKLDDLFIFLEDNDTPDIILLTEHWLEITEHCNVQEYYIVSKFCRQNVTGYGGTMILINKEFSKYFGLEAVNKYDHLLIENIFEFSIAVSKPHKLYIICIYRPPYHNIDQFLINLEYILMDLPVSSKIVLGGDFNVDYDAESSHSTLGLKDLLKSFNLQMHVKSPTRICNGNSTKIDYFCTNFLEEFVSCRVLPVEFSDHEALVVDCPFRFKPRAIKPERQGRIFSRTNFSKFREYILNFDWQSVLAYNEPIEEFHALLVHCFSESFPLCKMRKRKIKKTWITKGIRTASKNLKSLSYIKKFTNNLFFQEYFFKYRSIYRQIVKKAKIIFYENRLNDANNKTKEAWSIVNDLRGKNSVQPHVSDLDSNILNKYYCSIANRLTENLHSNIDPLEGLRDLLVDDTFTFRNTNTLELRCIFDEIKNKNSSGIDEISIKIFQNLNNHVLDILAQAINEGFSSGIFPNCLKTALVIPLHKSGSYDDPANFRPIALLPTLSKIIEKIIKKQTLEFIENNNIINSSQFGFQKSLSTNDAIFSFLESLFFNINDKEYAAAIFCDFSRAFDCVNHKLLKDKLSIYGFRDISSLYFESYLTGRKQVVKNGDSKSELQEISHGVPQGSVLGPILFILYINDLSNLKIQAHLTSFADDTTLKWSNTNQGNLKTIISEDILKVKDWCDANFLSFNIEKTRILSFRFSISNIELEDRCIKCNNSTKFLGLHIDNNLRFDIHILNLNKKLSSGCFAVRQTYNELGSMMARTTYFALIESHLRYGIAFWGYCSRQLFSSVFVLQKRALRFVCGAKLRDHCRPLFKRQQILTVSCIFILETVCLIFKKYKNSTLSHPHNTRNHGCIALPIPHFTQTKQSLIYDSVKMYNKLPNYCRLGEDYGRFRRSVKDLLTAKAYYDTDEFFADTF